MLKIKYIGQCGFIVTSEDNSLRIAFDPVLNDITDSSGNTIRCYPPVIPCEELNADYIFCSHDHIDHLAEETLLQVSKISPETKYIVPNGCKEILLNLGISEMQIITLSDLEEVTISSRLSVKAFSAAHPVHQLNKNGQDHNLCYAVKMDGKQLLHPGDTYKTERLMANIRSLGTIDLFFPPINGRDDKREAEGIIGNLFPEEACDIVNEADILNTIPTHFDMIKGNTEDPQRFIAAFRNKGCKGNYFIPSLDEEITLI